MSLRTRIHPEIDRPQQRTEADQPQQREPFVAPWRRRQIQQAGGRFVAVAWREVPA